ncbi:WD repeat-containing protein 36 [Rhypophila decipiens]|uniref:WD repeat-containing protein 36 n=1 Tax=Rhypophila decipiens TaxID=261697 RepID=A0AAN6YE55_9PEZI|nr:WD repeat-containing protein 36 [Rhypophila decipiens]
MPHSELELHSTKRQKRDVTVAKPTNASAKRGSAIFAPFRTIGLVSPTNVPFSSIPLGKTTFQITTSVGRSLQTYDLKRGLNLVFVTRPQTPADITATYPWKEKVLAAWGDARKGESQGLWSFQRGKKAAELILPTDLDQPIKQILVFGNWIVACALTRIEIFKSNTLEHYTTIFSVSSKKGDNELTGGVCHMPTFLNKIFVGRKNGWIEIWNISTGKLIYTIVPPAPNCGAVTCLQSTPAPELLAVAYSEGPLIIQNIVTDHPALILNAGTPDAPVTSISFRSDGRGAGQDGRKDGVMATATSVSGDVTFWDLNKGGRIMGVLRSAHNPPSNTGSATVRGGISKIEFLPGQPVIMTSGLDNSLKSWIFDETPFSPVPRILHQRSGHAAPVNCLQFLPSDFDGAEAGNKWLLSGGQDRSLWGWSLRRDGQSTELSQGNIRKKAKKIGILASTALGHGPTTTLDDLKAPEITCIASSLNRDGGIGAMPGKQPIWDKGNDKSRPSNAVLSGMTGWESVVTAHKNDPWARTWFWGRKRAGRWAFKTGDGTDVSTVAISPCGTFALVGSVGGSLDMFNLQSGQHRQRFPSRLTPAQERLVKLQHAKSLDKVNKFQAHSKKYFAPGSGRHSGAVTGIVVDSLNKTVISCSLDGTIKFWDFSTGNLVDEIDWAPMTRITACRYHPGNDLIAFACDDHSIRVVDIETKNTIRELWGCRDTINDFCFSDDGRWIVAASQDAVVRVWDLPTSHLIDAFRLEKPCTALAFSSTGEYLAGTTAGELGVHIWTNRSLFKHVPTRQISEKEIAQMSAPTASGEGAVGLVDAAFDDESAPEDEEGVLSAPVVDQLSKEMVTLSLVPRSKWQTLLHIDLIKQRNKPKEAPKAPEKAPFFLPQVGGGANNALAKIGEDATKKEDEGALVSRITQLERSRAEQAFTGRLLAGAATGDYNEFIEYLKSLSPSTADLELRSLAVGDEDESQNELLHFIHALTSRLQQRRDYELVQAWMAVFLKLHFDVVLASPTLMNALRVWKEHEDKEKKRLDDLVGYCGGVIGFLRSPRT